MHAYFILDKENKINIQLSINQYYIEIYKFIINLPNIV